MPILSSDITSWVGFCPPQIEAFLFFYASDFLSCMPPLQKDGINRYFKTVFTGKFQNIPLTPDFHHFNNLYLPLLFKGTKIEFITDLSIKGI